MSYFNGDFADLTPQFIDNLAETEGKKFAEKIKVSQIRNLYGAIERIRNDYVKENKKWSGRIEKYLVLLRPKLAYAVGRNRELKPLQSLFDEAVSAVLSSRNKEKALEMFLMLSEAVVAYHRYFRKEKD